MEIKRSTHIQPKDTRALKEFKKDYPDAQCFIFYGGTATLYLDDITALPIERALKTWISSWRLDAASSFHCGADVFFSPAGGQLDLALAFAEAGAL